MATLADDINLRYSTLIGTMSKFNTAISRYGEKKFVKTVGMMDDKLLGLGFTTAETAEFLGEYLNQQHRLGLNQLMTDQMMNKSAVRAAESIADWSQMLGKSRDEIKKGIGETLASADVEGFINDISDPAMKKRVRNSFAELGSVIDNPELRKMIERLATSDNPMADPVYQKLLQSGAHDLAASVMNMATTIKSGNLSQEGAIASIRDMGVQVGKLDLTQLRSIFGEAGMVTNDMTLAILKTNRDLDEGRLAERKAAIKSRDAFNSSLERLRTFWQKIIGGIDGTDGAMDTFTNVIEYVADILDDNAGQISKFINRMVLSLKAGADWLQKFLSDDTNGATIEEKIKKLLSTGFSKLGEMAGAAIISGLSSLGDIMLEGGIKFGDWLWQSTKDAVLSSLTWAGIGIKNMGSTVSNYVLSFIKTIGSGLSKIAPKFLSKIGAGVLGLISKIPFIGPLIFGSYEGIMDAIGQEGAWYKKLGAGLLGFASGIVKAFLSLPALIIDTIFGTDLQNTLTETLELLKSKIKGFFGGILNFFSNDKKDISKPDVNRNIAAAVVENNGSLGSSSIVTEKERRDRDKVSVTVENATKDIAKSVDKPITKAIDDSKVEKPKEMADINSILERLLSLNETMLQVMIQSNEGQKRLIKIINNKDAPLT
jgi:hypothetical protein